MVSQQFPGSTYVKLGYRGQTTFILQQHLDGFLFTLLKPGYQNVLVLWAGTNDLATGLATVQAIHSNLAAIGRYCPRRWLAGGSCDRHPANIVVRRVFVSGVFPRKCCGA